MAMPIEVMENVQILQSRLQNFIETKVREVL
jgi:hypothetical protein